MMFEQLALGVTPDAFQAIDMDSTLSEAFAMIDFQMPIAAEGERIIALKLVCIDLGATFNHAHCFVEQGLARDIGDDGDRDDAVALQNAEYRHFASGPASAPAFSSSTEIGIVQFDLVREHRGRLLGQESAPDPSKDPQHSGVAHPGLQHRDLQLEQFHQPQTRFQLKLRFSQKTVCKQIEGISAAIAALSQPIHRAPRTGITKNTPIFVPLFAQIATRSRFAFQQLFKRFDSHRASLILVPNV